MTSGRRGVLSLAATGSMISGASMTASAAVATFATAGDMSLVVSMSGAAAVVTWITGSGTINLTLGMSGNGAFGLTGSGGLSLVVPFDGVGTVVEFTGAGDMRGRARMEGSWTPFSQLSPESLAQAVWSAVAAQSNEPGSMGSKLNTASSGGVDLNALAAAVWAHATRTLTSGAGGGLTPAQAEQLSQIWALYGLDAARPATTDDRTGSRRITFGDVQIDLTSTAAPSGTVTTATRSA